MKGILVLIILLSNSIDSESESKLIKYYNGFRFLINTALAISKSPSISTVITNMKHKSNTQCGQGIRTYHNTTIYKCKGNKSEAYLSEQYNPLCEPLNYSSPECKCPVDRTGKYCEIIKPINCSITYISPSKDQLLCAHTNYTYGYHDDWVGIAPCTSVDNDTMLTFINSIHCENVANDENEEDFAYSINKPKLKISEQILIYPIIRIPNYNRVTQTVDFIPTNTAYSEGNTTIMVNVSMTLQNAVAGRLYAEYFITTNDSSIIINQKPLMIALEMNEYKEPESMSKGMQTEQVVWLRVASVLCIIILMLIVLLCRRQCARKMMHKYE